MINAQLIQEMNHEVVYIRYDNSNMKYVYLCCKCDFKWKNLILY